jgi:hypothetical protein
MLLQLGHYSPRRSPEQIQAIKAAVRQGLPFRQFWTETAAYWPEHLHISKNPRLTLLGSRLCSLYSYYAYRQRGDARFVNAITAQPSHYTDAQCILAARSAAAGLKFSQFWSNDARGWNKPMYRLRNWYRNYQKKWRDIVALSPAMSEAERVLAIAALGSRRGKHCTVTPMLSIRSVPQNHSLVKRFLRKRMVISAELTHEVLAGTKLLPCVRLSYDEAAAQLRELGCDVAVVK